VSRIRISRDLVLGAVVLLVALAVRLLRLLEMREGILWDHLIGDAAIHHRLAAEIATRDFWGHEPFYRAPLYPYFLGVLYKLFGPGLLAPRLIQILLGSLGCLLVYRIGRRIARAGPAFAAALVTALYWVLIQYDVELEIATLPTFLNLLGLWLLLRGLPLHGRGESENGRPGKRGLLDAHGETRAPSPRDALLAGLAFGLSGVARPDVLLFAFLAAAGLWLALPRGREGRRRALVMAAGILVPVAAVMARNLAVGGDFVPIASQGGVNFYIGNNPQSDGRTWMQPAGISRREYREQERRAGDSIWAQDNIWLVSRYAAEKASGRTLRPSQVSAYWSGEGLRFVLRSPGKFIALLARKAYYLLNRWELHSGLDLYALARSESLVLRALAWFHWGILLPLGLAGLAISLKRSGPAFLLFLYLLSYAVAIVLFFVNARFRIPMIPVLALCAVQGIDRLREAPARGRGRVILRYAAVFLVTAVIANTSWAGVRNPLAMVPIHNQIGDLYRSAGRYDRAVAEYEVSLRYAPRYEETYNNLGIVYTEANRLDEAEQAFARALEIDPEYALARANLGYLREKQGRPREALVEYRWALDSDPSLAIARKRQALAWMRMGEVTRALEEYEALRADWPDDADVLLALSQGYAATGEYAHAREPLVRLLQLDPANALLHHNLGVVHLHLNETEQAIAEFREALRLEASLTAPRVRLASIFAQAGRDSLALAYYNEALEQDSTLRAARLGRARIWKRLDEEDRARSDLDAWLDSSPGDQEARALRDSL
jgi:tetratricopeptide (TPR) repeat protein